MQWNKDNKMKMGGGIKLMEKNAAETLPLKKDLAKYPLRYLLSFGKEWFCISSVT